MQMILEICVVNMENKVGTIQSMKIMNAFLVIQLDVKHMILSVSVSLVTMDIIWFKKIKIQ